MGLFIGDSEPSKIFVGDTPISKVFLGDTQIRPTAQNLPYLCFTANQANSTIELLKNGSPTSVALETSTDGNTWTAYTEGSTIILPNVGDKIYWRNTSTSDTGFSTSNSDFYKFIMSGSIAGSGDTNYLLNKNSTTTLSDSCFIKLFDNCSSLTSAPSLPATTLASRCYARMFGGCTALTTIVSLPAINLASYCYQQMFISCSLIKLSATQTGEYQTSYRIPAEGNGRTAVSSFSYMFYGTGGTFTSDPSINTKYYTSNAVVYPSVI